jgi:protein tyrosine/serine phosphatase
VEDAWLTSAQEICQVILYKAIDGASLHNMRVDALNQRGLFGLNELILEAGKGELCRALKATTLHLEKKSRNDKIPVVIHCQQGKDRTGMLVMLLQSIMGVEDKDILTDYQASEAAIVSSKVEQTPPKPGKLDRAKMQMASKEVMRQTLQYIRERYGSVSPGYLQAAGFDDSWRIRLVTALLIHMEKPVDKRKSRSRL